MTGVVARPEGRVRRRPSLWEGPPTIGGGLGGLFAAAFGTLWTIGAASAGAPWFFCAFGVVFVCVGLAGAARNFSGAGVAASEPPPTTAGPVCPRCGKTARRGSAYCPTCGSRL